MEYCALAVAGSEGGGGCWLISSVDILFDQRKQLQSLSMNYFEWVDPAGGWWGGPDKQIKQDICN